MPRRSFIHLPMTKACQMCRDANGEELSDWPRTSPRIHMHPAIRHLNSDRTNQPDHGKYTK